MEPTSWPPTWAMCWPMPSRGACFDRLDDGEFAYEMDNGACVRVKITIDKKARSATFDFTGTSDQLFDNFNAPYSIARAASLYVVRTLIDDVIPMNDGCLRPIRLVVPTAQCSTSVPRRRRRRKCRDQPSRHRCLVRGLPRAGAKPGTMNNFTFGNERHQYYETVAGGSGAGPDHDGASAVQTHMTNSRLTDPEILETRLPVRLDEFSIRRGSAAGGLASWRRRRCPQDHLPRADARQHPRQPPPRSRRAALPAAMTPFPAATGWSASTGQSRS